jgi:eukaryotic-like serine/threonine-protein kinase
LAFEPAIGEARKIVRVYAGSREGRAMDAAARTASADLLSGWLRTGGLLQSALVRDLVARETLTLEFGTRVGAWRILEEIGRGGMGVVYRAERADGAYRQEIALKLIDGKAVRDDQRALFVRERQLLAELEHPSIVRLLDGGELHDGQPWFALELVRGEPLDAHAKSLPLTGRIDLMVEVATAVAYAHSRLVIHRDLKPGNVFVTRQGAIKLLDFGISGLALDHDPTLTGIGTMAYASPEQRAGAPPSTADDIYALGCLLAAIVGDEIPDDLRSIIAKASAHDAARRYASVTSLIDDLHRFRECRPVAAYAGSAGYRLLKRVRRNPVASIAVAAAFVLVAIFIAALIEQRGEARAEAARAQAINRFLNEDVLASANPLQSGDKNMTVRAALDHAAAAIEKEFANDPAVREDIEMAVARSYSGIDEFAIARTHAERAAAIDRQRFGVTGVATWPVRGLLADIAVHDGKKLQDADPMFGELLDEMKNAGALGTPLAIEIAYDRVTLHTRDSDNGWVIDTMRELLPRARRVDGEDSVMVVEMEATLANSLAFVNRLDEADSILRARLAKPPIADPAFVLAHLNIQQNLAFVLRKRGKPEEAIPLQKPAVEEYTKLLGRTHVETLHAINEYAGMLQDTGRLDESAALFRELVDSRLAHEGEEGYKTRTSMNNLGLVLSLQGKLDEADRWLQRVYDLELRLSGPDASDTLHAAHNLAGVKREEGKIDVALALQRDLLARAPKAFASDRPEPGIMRYSYAQTLIADRRYDDARKEIRIARADLVRTLGPEHKRMKTIDRTIAELDRDPVMAREHVLNPRD